MEIEFPGAVHWIALATTLLSMACAGYTAYMHLKIESIVAAKIREQVNGTIDRINSAIKATISDHTQKFAAIDARFLDMFGQLSAALKDAVREVNQQFAAQIARERQDSIDRDHDIKDALTGMRVAAEKLTACVIRMDERTRDRNGMHERKTDRFLGE